MLTSMSAILCPGKLKCYPVALLIIFLKHTLCIHRNFLVGFYLFLQYTGSCIFYSLCNNTRFFVSIHFLCYICSVGSCHCFTKGHLLMPGRFLFGLKGAGGGTLALINLPLILQTWRPSCRQLMEAL